jgi:hypothetical protein
MNVAKFQPVHAAVGNGPMIISVLADQGISNSRTFSNLGPPSASTLVAGNGKYNAGINGGWVVSVEAVAAGAGYAVGDTYHVGLCTITIDAIGTSGAVVDFHVSTYGNYSATAYPSTFVSIGTSTFSGSIGSGSGATFNLNWPAADLYVDLTSPTAPAWYVCTGAGTATSATWAKISGGSGGGWAGTWLYGTAYSVGQMVRVNSTATADGVTPTLGVFGCIAAIPAGAATSTNMIPQFPEPTTGTVYWQLIAFGVQEIGVCTGASQNAYINASGPF